MTNRCRNCAAPLAHDQRYCVRCGERRGELPAAVRRLLDAIRERGLEGRPTLVEPAADDGGAEDGAAEDGGAEDGAAEDGAGGASPGGSWLPRPSVAMLAALGMMAFGAEIGSLAGASPVASLAAAPLILLHDAIAPSTAATTVASAPRAAAGRSGAGSHAGSPSPPSSGGASSASSTSGATTTASSTSTAPANRYGLPSIGHVWVIMLSDEGYAQTFGSTDRYLAATLPRQGKLVENYYAVASGQLANGIALISGQGPTPQTAADCGVFDDISPGTVGPAAQVLGHGCVYPKRTETLADQLTTAHLTWRAYLQGLAGVPGRSRSCVHPKLGAFDASQVPQPGDPYVSWRDPFVYFHSVIDSRACTDGVVDLGVLGRDLRSASATPSLSFIAPDPCDDGGPQPCALGAPAGIAPMDRFLKTVVPAIQASPAYRAGGLIVITFDQAQQTGPNADSSSCCSTPRYPNLPAPAGTAGATTTGTGATGTAAVAATLTTSTTSTATTTTGTTTSTGGTTSSTSTSAGGTGTTTASGTGTATTTTTGETSTTGTTTTTTSPTTTVPATGTATTTTSSTTTATSPTTTTTTSTTPTAPPSLGDGLTSPTGGGGHVGMLLISPWIKPATIDVIDYYNHFSLLAGIEDVFGLSRLGYARRSQQPALSAAIFDGPGPKAG